jgi:hypothetical protein
MRVDRNVALMTGLLASVAGGLCVSALGAIVGNKICYHAQCGGYLDQSCSGTGTTCRYCSGATAQNALCFNKPGSTCNTAGGTQKCGKIAIGTCLANGTCGNSVITDDECRQSNCTGAQQPPSPPPG